jgi:uncharacterized protein YecE (DUF72 family)
MHPITVGTCGWSYKDWVGPFYPKGTAAGDYLSFYAERFNAVEVDSSFYACPSPKVVQGWYDKTPGGFGFSLKIPKTITHEKLLAECGKEVEEFLSATRLLKEKLLCCVLQFAFLNPQSFPHLGDFLTRLDGFLANWPKDVPIAVEIRNKYWFDHELAGQSARAAPVCSSSIHCSSRPAGGKHVVDFAAPGFASACGNVINVTRCAAAELRNKRLTDFGYFVISSTQATPRQPGGAMDLRFSARVGQSVIII